jgi:GNAT superfamily N-acetyltransferase
MSPLRIRRATSADAALIHRLICALALYEREPDAVEATPESLRAQLELERPPFECLIAEWNGEPAGFALYFPTYSTWRGKVGIHLEDLFVPEEQRGRGIGGALLAALARELVARGGARLEWNVLDWNEPARRFYQELGAQQLATWQIFRLDGQALLRLAARGPSIADGESRPPA